MNFLQTFLKHHHHILSIGFKHEILRKKSNHQFFSFFMNFKQNMQNKVKSPSKKG